MKKTSIKTVGDLKKILGNYDDDLEVKIQSRYRVFHLDSVNEHLESAIISSDSLDDYLDENDFS